MTDAAADVPSPLPSPGSMAHKDSQRPQELLVEEASPQPLPAKQHRWNAGDVQWDGEEMLVLPEKGSHQRFSTNQKADAALMYCQVIGCGDKLTDQKDYFKRYRICPRHLKQEALLVNGIHQRFCQQCGRFHPLSEFDDLKRTCRKRLTAHNERRRRTRHNPTTSVAEQPPAKASRTSYLPSPTPPQSIYSYPAHMHPPPHAMSMLAPGMARMHPPLRDPHLQPAPMRGSPTTTSPDPSSSPPSDQPAHQPPSGHRALPIAIARERDPMLPPSAPGGLPSIIAATATSHLARSVRPRVDASPPRLFSSQPFTHMYPPYPAAASSLRPAPPGPHSLRPPQPSLANPQYFVQHVHGLPPSGYPLSANQGTLPPHAVLYPSMQPAHGALPPNPSHSARQPVHAAQQYQDTILVPVYHPSMLSYGQEGAFVRYQGHLPSGPAPYLEPPIAYAPHAPAPPRRPHLRPSSLHSPPSPPPRSPTTNPPRPPDAATPAGPDPDPARDLPRSPSSPSCDSQAAASPPAPTQPRASPAAPPDPASSHPVPTPPAADTPPHPATTAAPPATSSAPTPATAAATTAADAVKRTANGSPPSRPTPPPPNLGYQVTEQLVSLSLKVFNCIPSKLPTRLRDHLVAVVEEALNMEGAIRPGCVHLAVDFFRPVALAPLPPTHLLAARLAAADPFWREHDVLVQHGGSACLLRGGVVQPLQLGAPDSPPAARLPSELQLPLPLPLTHPQLPVRRGAGSTLCAQHLAALQQPHPQRSASGDPWAPAAPTLLAAIPLAVCRSCPAPTATLTCPGVAPSQLQVFCRSRGRYLAMDPPSISPMDAPAGPPTPSSPRTPLPTTTAAPHPAAPTACHQQPRCSPSLEGPAAAGAPAQLRGTQGAVAAIRLPLHQAGARLTVEVSDGRLVSSPKVVLVVDSEAVAAEVCQLDQPNLAHLADTALPDIGRALEVAHLLRHQHHLQQLQGRQHPLPNDPLPQPAASSQATPATAGSTGALPQAAAPLPPHRTTAEVAAAAGAARRLLVLCESLGWRHLAAELAPVSQLLLLPPPQALAHATACTADGACSRAAGAATAGPPRSCGRPTGAAAGSPPAATSPPATAAACVEPPAASGSTSSGSRGDGELCSAAAGAGSRGAGAGCAGAGPGMDGCAVPLRAVSGELCGVAPSGAASTAPVSPPASPSAPSPEPTRAAAAAAAAAPAPAPQAQALAPQQPLRAMAAPAAACRALAARAVPCPAAVWGT